PGEQRRLRSPRLNRRTRHPAPAGHHRRQRGGAHAADGPASAWHAGTPPRGGLECCLDGCFPARPEPGRLLRDEGTVLRTDPVDAPWTQPTGGGRDLTEPSQVLVR